MPLSFTPLAMMDLRSAPGEVLDRVARNNEAFVIERNGQQMACLVPLSIFMPDIQPARIAREFEQLNANDERHTTSITDKREIELHFRQAVGDAEGTVSVRLPHGYPNASPKVFVTPLPEKCPHRWQDGSLCLFGVIDVWNPGQHDVMQVLRLTRRWIAHFERWNKNGAWPSEETGG